MFIRGAVRAVLRKARAEEAPAGVMVNPREFIRAGVEHEGTLFELVDDVKRRLVAAAERDQQAAVRAFCEDGNKEPFMQLAEELAFKGGFATDAQLDALDEALTPLQKRIKSLRVDDVSYKRIAKATGTNVRQVIHADMQSRFIARRVLDRDLSANAADIQRA